MNPHAAKAAAAERTSVSARREPGARTIVSASLSGMSAPSGLADSPFGHEFGHSLGCRQVVSSGRDICFADSDHRGVVAQQFDCGLEGLKVLGREQDDALAPVASHVNAFMGAIHLLGDLGQAGLHLRKGHRYHPSRLSLGGSCSDSMKAANSSAMRSVRRRYTCSIFGIFRVTSSKGWCIQRLWQSGERERARMGYPFGASPRVLPSSSLY